MMKKTISALFVICILNASFISCKTHEILSAYEASEIKSAKNLLLLHTPSKIYTLYNYKFTDTMLVGDLMEKTKTKGYTIHVHTKRDFYAELDEKTVYYYELSISNIDKITYSKVSTGKSILFGVGIYLAVGIIVSLSGSFGTTISGGI